MSISKYYTGSQIQFNGFHSNYVACCEAHGLGLCFIAYADYSAGEEILEVGFNSNSGYVYIALENGITICSMLGREVEYLVTNFDNGEEYFFPTYHEAETFEPYEEAE
jgi:hypothetical protein